MQVIEGFGLLSFTPLAIDDRESVGALLMLVDKANGYAFAGLARTGALPPEIQYSAGGAGRQGGERARGSVCLRLCLAAGNGDDAHSMCADRGQRWHPACTADLKRRCCRRPVGSHGGAVHPRR